MTFLSLFSGIGGLDLGLERAGWKCVGQVEIDDYCRRVLAKHWPDVPKWDDVRTFTGESFERPDAICGGDPCQANSNAARSHGGSKAESLAGEFLRIVERLKPSCVIRENPATVRKDAPWPWWRFATELAVLGYDVTAIRIRACCVGADIPRRRLFLCGSLSQSSGAGLQGHVGKVMARTHYWRQDADTAGPNRWSAAPRICRGVDGIPNRVDRLRALGNAVVPQVAEWIGRQIITAVEA